jgi:hypothetical protein
MGNKLVTAIDTDKGFYRMKLTWSGHDFAADSRVPEIWDITKKAAGHLSLGAFAGVLTNVATKYAQQALDSMGSAIFQS